MARNRNPYGVLGGRHVSKTRSNCVFIDETVQASGQSQSHAHEALEVRKYTYPTNIPIFHIHADSGGLPPE
jgi:hypothetical protein